MESVWEDPYMEKGEGGNCISNGHKVPVGAEMLLEGREFVGEMFEEAVGSGVDAGGRHIGT